MNAELAINLLITLLSQAQEIGNLISTAQAAGRDLTDAEIDQCVKADDEAKAALQEAIDNARRLRTP